MTQPLDWAQAFAQKGATLIAGTGYQYGDTDFLEYSERLYAGVRHAARARHRAPVARRQRARHRQSRRYLAEHARTCAGIDAKALLEATLYGLPMLSVNLPAGPHLTRRRTSSIVGLDDTRLDGRPGPRRSA